MKFAEHLSAHITPEWRKQYINYEVKNLENIT
jgi:SPX domain protein involved in polyphosphate accumulation